MVSALKNMTKRAVLLLLNSIISISFARYTPNSQRELARLDYRMTWEDAFRAYLLELDKRNRLFSVATSM